MSSNRSFCAISKKRIAKSFNEYKYPTTKSYSHRFFDFSIRPWNFIRKSLQGYVGYFFRRNPQERMMDARIDLEERFFIRNHDGRTPLEDSRESVENNWARILGSPNAPVSSNHRYLIDRIRGSGIDRRPFRIARGFVTSMTDITRKLWSYWLAAFRIAIAKPFWPKPEIN